MKTFGLHTWTHQHGRVPCEAKPAACCCCPGQPERVCWLVGGRSHEAGSRYAAPPLGRADTRTYGLAPSPAPAVREEPSSTPGQYSSRVWDFYKGLSLVFPKHHIKFILRVQNDQTLFALEAFTVLKLEDVLF